MEDCIRRIECQKYFLEDPIWLAYEKNIQRITAETIGELEVGKKKEEENMAFRRQISRLFNSLFLIKPQFV